MMRKDWKKQLKRVRDIADKNFTRNEKPEQLNESLIKLEQRIESIKLVCQTVGKKLLGCLQLHGVEREKRLKKLPESALSKQLHESSNQFEEKEAIRQTLSVCSDVEGDLASFLMSYEDNVEQKVLQPLQTLLERDIPAIMKLRKQVAKQAQEVDSLKSRYNTRQTVNLDRQSEATKKATQALEDLEEAVNKLELYKDQLATEMYNFYAREGELSEIFTYLIESQLKYHSDATVALQKVLPEMKSIEQHAQRPIFGCSLEDHLRITKQPIATVIQESISALLEEGLDQEGLFRIAAGATKLKKLKAAFDAGMVNACMDEYMTDPHCIASALKLYLRELPEPLLTFDLYDDWAEASQLPPDQRVNAIASILKKMKKPYFDNLKILIQFLARLADNAEVNKMSPTNLAIVVGPNLLWSRSGDGQNILTTGVQSSIAESMISNAALLFGDDSFPDRNKSSCLAQMPAATNPSFSGKNNTNNNNNAENNSSLADRISIIDSLNSSTHAAKAPNTDECDRLSAPQSHGPSSAAPVATAARRFQAQKDFWCRRVDSVSVRSWPERPLVTRRHEARQNAGLAMHESFLRTRPLTDCGISIPDPVDFGVKGRSSRVSGLRPSPPKSVHSEMYSTAFALQSLGDVNCSDYLAKVRTLWDSHMECSKKRTPSFDMSASCHGLRMQPKLTRSDSELGENTSLVVSQPPGGGSAIHVRDSNNSIAMQQTIAKVDSSDSLSSDSLGADSALGTNQSSVSGSEVSSLSKGVETPDISSLVAPKRAVRKTQAPLPPTAEATAQVTKVTTTSVMKSPSTSDVPPATHQKVATTTRVATVAVAIEESTESGDSADKTKTTPQASVTTTHAKATITPEEVEAVRKSPAAVRSHPVTVETSDEKTHQPVSAKRSNQFAANRAMLSNILTGPRKTLLTRPNTVYMEDAKMELIKTAEEQNDDEKSETNGAGNSHGKTGEEGTRADSPPTTQQKKKLVSVTEEGGSKKSAKKTESDEEIWNPESDEEVKGTRRSRGGETVEDQLPKKPERPVKPVRPSQGDATTQGGNRPSSGAKASTEDLSGKDDAAAESSSAAKTHGEPTVGTQGLNSGKPPKHPPPEVPDTVPQQPVSGSSGLRPPKPPPPSIGVGQRLKSDSAIEEDTYL